MFRLRVLGPLRGSLKQPLLRSSKLSFQPLITLRFQSSTPQKKDLNTHLPRADSIRKTIPGETEQSNSLSSRLPTFPLRSRATLLPKPGVPTAATTPLRSMLEILNKKHEPELIYEAETHKVYFLICGAMAIIFTIYGLTFVDWGFRAVFQLYDEDQDLLMLATRLGMCIVITGIAGGVLAFAVKFPTRLIRRIWLVPGKNDQKFVRFSTHPVLPGSATPVYTIPLKNLVRSHKSKIFTKNGIYGTLDKSTFFFLLKEADKKFGYWIVDRNGWFWGDGRVFDVLFGKESLDEAAKGQTYNDKLKKVNDKLLEEKNKLKEEHGSLWQFKTSNKMFQKDLKKIVNIVNDGKNKKLPKK